MMRFATMSFKILGIGEVLWDLLPQGKQLGGAPANFVYHARAMGADATLISRVGDDALGRELIERLFALGVPTCEVALDAAHPTGTVTVDLGPQGEPRYVIQEDVAWDYLAPDSLDTAAQADAIAFGTLAQRNSVSREAIHSVLGAARPDALRVLDLNLRGGFFSAKVIRASLELANVLKLNDAELPALAKLLELPRGEPRQQIEELANRHKLRLIARTRGAEGSVLYREGDWSERMPEAIEVSDTIGAGDAFTAAATVGMLLGWALPRIHAAAESVAAFVCSQPGATPAWPADLRELFAEIGGRK
jgi:fructokinase